MQTKAEVKHFMRQNAPAPKPGVAAGPPESPTPDAARSGTVYGLVSNLFFAAKIAQAAKHSHMAIHNFDKAQPLLEHAKKKLPALIILDWDGCEAEAFKLLKELRTSADLKGVPTIGYLSHVKADLKAEAQRAGCDRVYAKSEFSRLLDDLLMRYSL